MKQPWDVVAAFSPERLGVLTQLLVSTRKEALKHHEPSKGDTNWGLGCKVYERSCYAITNAAHMHPWLEILDDELHFVFLAGGVPLRFGRGDHEEPSPHLLKRRPNEVSAQQLALSDEWVGWIWRLIVETDPDTLETSHVYLVQASSDGQVGHSWELNLPENVSSMDPAASLDDGVELARPSVEVKPSADDEASTE